LFLSYFGTDQSQVARYLGGKNLTESRMGLIFNGLLKIPMQFLILFIGVLVFVFYQFNQAPVFHNLPLKKQAGQVAGNQISAIEKKYDSVFVQRKAAVQQLVTGIKTKDEQVIAVAKKTYALLKNAEDSLRMETKHAIVKSIPSAKTQDKDYIFLNFVLTHLPHGLIGLLLAVMFSAAMSSMASELNALAATSTMDIYARVVKKNASPKHYLLSSRGFTILWALIAMVFAWLANFSENLIQYVNIVGSLFYGTILGIFLVAFYLKYVKSNAVFWAAIIAEAIVLICYFYFYEEIAFLYYNIIGCMVVISLAVVFEKFNRKKN
jgi:uncharacterized sodium:solute symporter family permease YidK